MSVLRTDELLKFLVFSLLVGFSNFGGEDFSLLLGMYLTCLFSDSSDMIWFHSTARSEVANPHVVCIPSIFLRFKSGKDAGLQR